MKDINYVELQQELDKIGDMTEQQIDDHVRAGNVVIAERAELQNLNFPKLPDGWAISNSDKAKHKGGLIFVAKGFKKLNIWYEGQYQRALKAGLPPAVAQAWVRTPNRDRAYFLNRLPEVFNSAMLLEGYKQYSPFYNHNELKMWKEEYGITDSMDRKMRTRFSALVKELNAASTSEKIVSTL